MGSTGTSHAASATQALHAYPGVRVPVVTVAVNDPGARPGHIFLTPRNRVGRRTGPMILDSQGRIVWFNRLPKGRTSLGLQPQVYNGKPVLTWGQRPPFTTVDDLYNGSPKTLYNVIADESYKVLARVRARGRGVRTDLHDMTISRRNTALVLGFRLVTRRLRSLGGPRKGPVIDSIVQEIDIPTGRVLFSWSSIRHVPLNHSVLKPARRGAWDYFHANSVAEDADGNLLISARHTSAIYKVDRRTGDVIWTLGGKASSFQMGPGASFWYQHDPQRQADGTITLFDNHGSEFDKRGASRALELSLDENARTATVVREFGHPKGAVLATSQGGTRMLPGGNLFTGWGSSPWFSEHSRDGRLLFAAYLPSRTYQSYRAFKGLWRGNPPGRPTVAASTRSGRLIMFAAWNGATRIARWRVLGGSLPQFAKPLGEVPWAGLETAMRFPSRPAWVIVEALDAAGNVIGRSRAIKPEN